MTSVQNSRNEGRKDFPQLQSINRISKIPVVETGVQYATGMYWKIKNSNALMRWSLKSVEGGIQMAVEKSLSAIPLLEMPLFIVDSIVCKSLDTVEQRVPAINYPPELLFHMTKDLVTARIVQPAIKRVDSVKQFGVNGATKYTEIAASRLDTALNVADQYVDKYLPDSTDSSDPKDNNRRNSKTSQTIEHVNRFSRKLQRRLTKRTLAEARALKKQSADTAQFLLYLLDLLIKDPKQFMEKMKAVWSHLSQDEPENQIPPANLEQLIAMLTREMARRFVHITNYSASTISHLPAYTVQAFHFTNHHLSILIDNLIKTVNLEGAKETAIARAKTEIDMVQCRIRQFYDLIQHLLESIGSHMQKPNPITTMIPLKPIPVEDNDQDHTNKENTNNIKPHHANISKNAKKTKHESVKPNDNKKKSEDVNSNKKSSEHLIEDSVKNDESV